MEHIRFVLQEMIEHTEEPPHKISCLTSSSEKSQSLYEWNSVPDNILSNCEGNSILTLFEDQLNCHSSKTAILYQDHPYITYVELNKRANQLAHFLIKRGVGRDTLIMLVLERSVEMIVGILGILKSGAAYVPVDIKNPPLRFQYILDDINTPIIITDKQTIDKLPSTLAQIICLDTEWEAIATQSIHNPAVFNDPNSLAYVIYTSGSTGNPKGL